MEVLRKDEDDWWFAKHSDGRTGSIPVPYVQVVSIVYVHNVVLFPYLQGVSVQQIFSHSPTLKCGVHTL